MKNEVIKKEAKKEVFKKPVDINTGDKVIDDRGNVYKVGKKIKEGFELLHQYNSGEWGHYGDIELKRFEWKYLKIEKPIEELETDVLEEVKTLKNPHDQKEELSDSTALTKFDKNYFLSIKAGMEESRKKFEILERVLNRKRNELRCIVSEFETQLEKCNKVLGSIELYLGIREDIIQIQKGNKADQKTKISLRQQVLFMDEEVGDPSDGGLDFDSIDKFDEWLTKDKNYLKVAPEEKCVVAIKIRREDKHYCDDFWHNFMLNQDNKKTFILIRNGENIYRIWAAVHIYPRLFPQKAEIEKLFKAIDENGYYKSREDGLGCFEHISKNEAEDKVFGYKNTIILLQGLLDRTLIFQPLPKNIQLFLPETYGDFINFVYDDEVCLTAGRKYYRDWLKENNSKIKRGSRIYFSGFTYYHTAKDASRRFPFITFQKPDNGVYTVVRVEKETSQWGETKIVCHFNPKDEIYDNRYWGADVHKRKKAIPFYLFYEDDCLLNYDLLSLDDMEYYIHSRIDRGNYLHMIPVLWGIRKQRLKEIEWEKGFVANLKLRLPFENKEELEKKIWATIKWWKNKVIWKRPLMKDDAKALRMITAKIQKDLNIETEAKAK